MRRWITAVSGALALALLLTATSVQAQTNSDVIDANANVLTPLQVTGQQALDFGDVFPGVTYTIAPTDPAPGIWRVQGYGSAEIDLTFGLPAQLNFGVNNFAIDFAGNTAGVNTANNPAGASVFDPAGGYTGDLGAGGDLYVFIGAQITPATGQAAGLYTNTISLTADYTGN